ncbi:hypothetical protein JOF41_006034 [Saccharothrix coeruleofusca]|uniref:hypothetical protein n=1 Tax=Saccharothrix coeruleofusca TaxID=33919 RepID=UPI001AE2A483|nr:hypothetical protein [Saccharothrix coeruleofusca]MBP2339856.1 hypothetical protein [Saccharothrix coeruleofusca]
MPQLTRRAEKREWLIRCTDLGDRPGVCAISVSDGTVEITGPDGDLAFALEHDHILEFRAAFDAAIARAGADLHDR